MRTRRAKSARVRAEAWTLVELYDEAYERMDPPTRRRFLEARIAELERFCGKLALENEVLKKGLSRYRSDGGTP